MAAYPFRDVEKKWQSHWEGQGTFATPRAVDTSKPKFYVLDMFPYPSGSGLHVGHPEGYTATDIVARYKRMRGFNVLHPIGWDAFGLPAEQYALKTNTHPRTTTQANIGRFREQLKSLGFSYDWSREIDTTDPKYYRWTQWIFLKLFERGLAYQAEQPVWWCPELGTTLANEEVIDGHSEVGGYPCVRRPLRQWVLRITHYAERLLEGLDDLDWPESTKEMQRNWIGRSEGAEVDFPVAGSDRKLTVFTTRPDTIFGATYMVLAPEHPLVGEITSPEQAQAVREYCEAAARKSDLERTEVAREKTGVFAGASVVNPATGDEIPVWIADYVLASYGTGAIMAVPGQDERDWAFADVYGLPIIRTVMPPEDFDGDAYTGEGPAINSGFLDGLDVDSAKTRIIDWMESEGHGRAHVAYKLRDWLFSRQRYWGEPFPIAFEDGEAVAVGVDELPVTLPDLDEFKPSGSPEGPLALAKDWLDIHDETSGKVLRRETNTMPQWAGSCWYFLRYIDPDNDDCLVDPELEKYWMPVDLYIGGAEHAVLHLLYARFWHKVLYDAGVVASPEPFGKLVHQGMILGEYEYTAFRDPALGEFVSAELGIRGKDDAQPWQHSETGVVLELVSVDESAVQKSGDGFVLAESPGIRVDARAYKMSKSRGNVVNPDEIIDRYGADAFRLYEMFMGPLEQVKPWNTRSVEGPARFLNRVWRLYRGDKPITATEPTNDALRSLHRTIRKVTEDIEALRFNTAIAALMEFVNEAQRWDGLPASVAADFVKLLSPFAPHIGEELWQGLDMGGELSSAPWPKLEEAYLVADTVKIPVQVNGKMRSTITVAQDAGKEDVLAIARSDDNVARHLGEAGIRREIYVPGRIVNFVTS